ncbi:hypothetical protein AMJ80_03680 [bacterium SM23_31]|nr:MAG: hypothetical protein AMJ80_03680 [bacterium SM23_31]
MDSRKNMMLVMLAGILMVWGCASHKAIWGSPEEGIIMSYHQPEGTVNKYKYISQESGVVDQMGTKFNVTMDAVGDALQKIVKVSDDKISQELSYTSLSITQKDDRTGTSSIPTANVLNKPLILETGKRGENADMKNIGDLPSLENSVNPQGISLMTLIHELALKPVKINDTWNSLETAPLELPNANMDFTFDTDYTFTGMEKKMEFDCMKISATGKYSIKGSMTIEGQNMGMERTVTFESTIFFAYKNGFIVEISEKSKGNMIIDIPAANQEITMPFTGTVDMSYVK